jgi:hypothetical protein
MEGVVVPQPKGVVRMSHNQDMKKEDKKKPGKSLKEKRLEKQAKKASKNGPVGSI